MAPMRGKTRTLGLSAAVLLAAALGTVSLILFLRPTDDAEADTLAVSDVALDQPWCNEGGSICVTAESLAAGYALYTLEPHEHFRANGCHARWLPDFDLTQVGNEGTGAFRSPCSGATFDRLGLRLFGPSPRALDRYAAEGEPGSFEIDLTRLIRGDTGDAAPRP